MRDILLLLNALLLAVGLILALDPVAARVGLMDRPGGRKTHDRAVPVTGGLAMFGAFLLAATQLEPSGAFWPLAAGLAVLVALGVADDLANLRPWPKLAGQAVAASILVLPGHLLIDSGQLFGLGGPCATQIDHALTLLFVVGLINAVNMLDGLDGLAGGAAASALSWLAVAAALSGKGGSLMQILLLLAAVLGFLVFNAPHPWRRKGAVFMGDTGSMMLGAAIAYFVLDLSAGSEGPSLPSLLWLVVVPASDTLILFVCRAASGQNPLRGDLRHVHHRLLQAGLSRRRAAALLVAVCFGWGGIGVAGWQFGVPGGAGLPALLVPFALHASFALHGWRLIGRTSDGQGAAANETLPRPRESFS